MVVEERTEARVVMTRRTDSGVYEIIVHEDGGYDLASDGKRILCFHWRPEQLEQCIQALDRLLRTV